MAIRQKNKNGQTAIQSEIKEKGSYGHKKKIIIIIIIIIIRGDMSIKNKERTTLFKRKPDSVSF
jgi:hypothetical protein